MPTERTGDPAGTFGPPPLPSLFDSIRARSNCTCGVCYATWEAIDQEQMTDRDWYNYAAHLRFEHGWLKGDVEE